MLIFTMKGMNATSLKLRSTRSMKVGGEGLDRRIKKRATTKYAKHAKGKTCYEEHEGKEGGSFGFPLRPALRAGRFLFPDKAYRGLAGRKVSREWPPFNANEQQMMTCSE
jgi:hypothetical protein